jgi:hypothetical protein
MVKRRSSIELIHGNRVHGEDFEDVELLVWYRALEDLKDRATRAYQHGISWRKFRMGGSGLGVDPEGRTHRFDAANHKPFDRPRNRDLGDECPEMRIIDAAKTAGCTLLGMAVVGDYQPDDFSGIDLGVTISCVHCRRTYRQELKSPISLLRPCTRLYFSNIDDPSRHVELTVRNLLAIEDSGDD